MNIQSKFDINDILVQQFSRKSQTYFQALQVLEVVTQSCYAGTQVFYFCRPIIGHREVELFKEKRDYVWRIDHGLSKNDHEMGWQKYREDELLKAPQEILDIITQIPTENN